MSHPPVRRVEIVAALSLATDLAIGQPVEFALRSCSLAVALADAARFDQESLRQVYYQSLLRYIGCNADTEAQAALLGDEMIMRHEFALIDQGNPREVLSVVLRALRRANADRTLPSATLAIVRGFLNSRSASVRILTGHCEVAQRLAARLGFDAAVAGNLGQLYERWDGRGLPHGLRGEAIAPAVRVVSLAQDVIALADALGKTDALATIRARRGKAYDPALVDVLLASADRLLDQSDQVVAWDAALALEPRPHQMLGAEELDEACLVIADFVDIRWPDRLGHSRAVAALTETAVRYLGWPASDADDARRAGWVHDLGEMSVPVATWAKSGPLSDREWDAIRLHPHHTERILTRSSAAALRCLAVIGGEHHERVDGSGYFRGLRGPALNPVARVLAVAEAYQTKLESRPHRAALGRAAAASELKRLVQGGALDGEAVAAVLSVAGHAVPPIRRDATAGLTAREIEVLRLIAAGRSAREIGRLLGMSVRTADNHTRHIYDKIGVSTRAAAALFAVERGLLAPGNAAKKDE
jgi:HD-GYP domain-containing protein (c-di-GMP phosphodiesterase class II)